MKTEETKSETSSPTELIIKMAIKAWEIQNDRMNKVLDSLTDEDLLREIAPGKNRGIYLVGHLTAVSDNLLPLFDLGDGLYPQLGNLFVKIPDKSGVEFPTAAELRKYWSEVNAKLAHHFHAMQPNDWLAKHNAVSEEDFAKEPHRNKLNVLLNRTNHQSYHLGQLILLLNK
jgi:hypothetical protein